MKWFGNNGVPFAPACETTPFVPTPIGQRCTFCMQIIMEEDIGFVMPHLQEDGFWKELPQHQDCMMFQIVGKVE